MSKLFVDEIKGNTSTTVTLTSGQTLAASGATISGNQFQYLAIQLRPG